MLSLPRPTRRLLLSAASATFLGAVSTCLVAFALAAWFDPGAADLDSSSATAHSSAERALHYWRVSRRTTHGYGEFMSHWIDPGSDRHRSSPRNDPIELIPSWVTADFLPRASDTTGEHVRVAHAWGWPLPALWYKEAGDARHGQQLLILPDEVLIPLTAVRRVRPESASVVLMNRYLPLRPIWTAFALNTLVYAVAFAPICFFLPSVIIAARARFRVRRGRCPNCGYIVHKAVECPECGHHANASTL